MVRYKIFTTLIIATLLSLSAASQEGKIRGIVTEKDNTIRIEGARVTDQSGNTLAVSGSEGSFSFSHPSGELTIYFNADGYQRFILHIRIEEEGITDLGMVTLVRQDEFRTDLPTLTIADSDAEDGMESQTIHGLLSSSSDIFVSTAAYTFGQARFQIRGYEPRYSDVFINGFRVNDAESGGPIWSNWGGLNDVMRNSVVTTGMDPDGNSFEPVGGISRVITNASEYRKGIKAVYSLSNRTYRNRAMITWSSGLLDNGWAFTGSYSRRWSQEGYAEGTFYDAHGLFIAVEKIINDKHSLNLTALDAIYSRGVAGGSTQEAYDLAGSNYYNPYWGYQNGGKRNSRVRSSNKPLITLAHTWKISDNTTLKSTAGHWFGRGGYSALNWYDSEDPRPDYWRKLPSYFTDEADQERIADAWSDPSVSQINWDALYTANSNNPFSVEDANGIPGNTVTGLRSRYIVEDRRNDISQFQFNTTLSHQRGNFTLTGGLFADLYTGKNFNVVDDLLGGDFWVDIDQFAERDYPDDPDAIQNDLNHPNRIVKEGDIYSHNYSSHQNQIKVWGLTEYSHNRTSLYLGVNLANTRIWREGHTVKGLFPDNSYGNSDILTFTTYGIKAGGEFRLTGRHIFRGNAMVMTEPPTFRSSFLSPRTRNSTTPGIKEEQIIAGDISYITRLPFINGRITGYYTRFTDLTEVASFYHDELRNFVNHSMTGINKEHYGLEYGAEFKLSSTITINTVASLNQFIWTKNPEIIITQDNNSEILSTDEVWVKYFRASGSPQTALAAGIEYSSPNYWWAGITGSWYDNIYLDFNPVSRTKDENGYYPYWEVMERLPSGFLIDAFIGKSWLINGVNISLTANLSNLTNNKELITGGFEQYRFSPENPDQFPPKYYYMYGFNYFINLSIRM
jgi:hypothetical protein